MSSYHNPFSATTRLRRAVRGILLAGALAAIPTPSLAQLGIAQPGGIWDPPVNWPIVAVHMLHQPDGHMLIWAYNGLSANHWDPLANVFVQVPQSANIFCSGHAATYRGSFVVAGGIQNNSTQIYNYGSDTWTAAQNMATDRFYPTLTTLPDGRILALSGNAAGPVLIPEVYDPSTNTWTQLANAPQALPLFPFNFLLPNGLIFSAGPGLNSYFLKVSTETWTPGPISANDGASAVMLVPGVVLKCGGDSTSTNVTEIIDLNTHNPQWVQVGSMAYKRHHPDLVQLPDGTVLVVGGHDEFGAAVLPAELFHPRTNSWTTLSSMLTPRRYHSTASILQDTRVVVAGGDGFPSAEIFNPPYIYQGPAPKIITAPPYLAYNGPFTIKVQLPGLDTKISAVSLLRLSGVTHSFDQNQRYIPLTFETLPFSDAANTVTLVAKSPTGPTIAPPGAYLLFVISNRGVPSAGHYILFG